MASRPVGTDISAFPCLCICRPQLEGSQTSPRLQFLSAKMFALDSKRGFGFPRVVAAGASERTEGPSRPQSRRGLRQRRSLSSSLGRPRRRTPAPRASPASKSAPFPPSLPAARAAQPELWARTSREAAPRARGCLSRIPPSAALAPLAFARLAKPGLWHRLRRVCAVHLGRVYFVLPFFLCKPLG